MALGWSLLGLKWGHVAQPITSDEKLITWVLVLLILACLPLFGAWYANRREKKYGEDKEK